jgi:hypothetical protein
VRVAYPSSDRQRHDYPTLAEHFASLISPPIGSGAAPTLAEQALADRQRHDYPTLAEKFALLSSSSRRQGPQKSYQLLRRGRMRPSWATLETRIPFWNSRAVARPRALEAEGDTWS